MIKNKTAKIQNLLEKYSTKKNILIMFIFTNIIYGAMLLFTIPKVMKYSNGMKILDLLPTGYSYTYTQKLLESLGKSGIETYLYQQIPLDMIYPALFAITYSLLLTFIYKISFAKNSIIQLLCLLPLFSGLFDYLENAGIIVMLNIYPDFKPGLAILTSNFSVLKSISTTIVFVLIIIGFLMIYIKKMKNIFLNA